MKIAIVILAFIFVCANALAQENPNVPNPNTEQQLENQAQTDEAETEDDTYLQQLDQYRKNPINLNETDADELKELKLLSDLQISSFISYRLLVGKLISIYELQAVPNWDIATIQRVLPFVTVINNSSLLGTLGTRLKGGEHSLLFRATQVLEQSRGFLIDSSVASNYYIGSRQRYFFRYKYNYKNLLQYGLTGDKDPGEQFFKGNQRSGFDFYSFHFFARKLGKVQALALGDFTVNMGQGLIQWQSLAFKKSADVVNIKRQATVLRPYNSAGEFYFHRGAGITVKLKEVEFTAFGSYRKLDANFNADTAITNEDFVSSILNSGYHRTPGEVADKNILTQIAYGGNINWRKRNWHIGLNGIRYQFNLPIQKSPEPYNLFAISGKDWANYSMDYSYTHRNFHFFGEAAMDRNNHSALLNGLLISLDNRVDASIVHRHISRAYQSFYTNAFTENTFPTNETGLYTGIVLRPLPACRIELYADVYKFPWLKFRVDAPSRGRDYLAQITYKPNKQVEIYSRFSNASKQINLSGLELPGDVKVVV